MSGFETGSYAEVYRRSIDQPEEFWMEAARAVDWTVTPTRTADAEPDGTWHWFPDGRLNSCYNAVDRHVAAGRGAQIALIHDSAMTGAVQRFSYAHLLDEVARVAGMMASHGVGVGDRVLIYMPMVPEAVFAMLACARLGAVHSVVFGGFAAAELAKRIDDAAPVLVMAASCGLEPGRVVAYKPLLDEAISLATHKPRHCIVLQRPQCHAALKPGRDLDWAEQLAGAPAVGCVAVASGDPLYILYTSGTTGNGSFVRLTRHTIVDPGQLREHLKKVRAAGHAIDDREIAPDLYCLAVPIVQPDRSVTLALSVSSIDQGKFEKSFDALLKKLTQTAEQIARRLRD